MNTQKIQDMYFGLFEKFKHIMIKKNVNRMLDSYTSPDFKLTKEQKEQIEEFYSPYEKITDISHAFYTEKTGVFSPYYLPMDIYLNRVDEYFDNRAESKYLDNKCYYYTIFPGIAQPEAVAFRIGGLWYSGEHTLIKKDEVYDIICKEKIVFAKQATASCGGKGVMYISEENGDVKKQFDEFLSYAKEDIVIQRPVKQHKDISNIFPHSVNTMRIISLLTEDGVKIYSSILRVGVGEEKVDNASKGGVTCGIADDGKLKARAFKLNGERHDVHPTNGFVFDGYQLPGFDRAKELVKKAHPMVPHFKLVSWDIAITEDGSPILIEANLAKGSSEFHQLNNGPLFGEDTKKILDEVYGITKK